MCFSISRMPSARGFRVDIDRAEGCCKWLLGHVATEYHCRKKGEARGGKVK